MENSTVLPVVGDCLIYEHEPLWIMITMLMSAIATLMAVFFRKRRARTHALPLPRLREGEGREEEEEYK